MQQEPKSLSKDANLVWPSNIAIANGIIPVLYLEYMTMTNTIKPENCNQQDVRQPFL